MSHPPPVSFRTTFREPSELDNAAPYRDGDGLCAILRAELIHNVLHMYFDGFLGGKLNVADIVVSVAAGTLAQTLNPARRKVLANAVPGEFGRNLRRDSLLVRMDK